MINSKKLKACIFSAGYSQRSLAKTLGMSVNTLNAKINGKSDFNVDEVMKVCDALKIESPEERCAIFLP